ncbi:MAG TPA: 16S rRNA (adenine(1518)-N(6)/adenine(1519)-N(6))-dimethyltransferase RsmA [archaeon]|nr:16S rRNA (adenine(1518)-N(6)/adenine(1519)-N(6))-dimethyltransferase RsmA [archaeon]
MQPLFQELNQLMVQYRFRPSRKMAQLFMIDSETIKKILALADLKQKDVALEIGAGTGFLTREIQKHCKVIAVELDDILFMLLEKELPKENLELVHGDFLKLNLPRFNKVVSLPPYTIASPIMYRLFELGFEKAVIVFQAEFAERLVAEPGFFDYNALSVLTQYFCDVKIAGKVSASCFFPSPKSESAIVVLQWKKRREKAKSTLAFQKFVKSLFRFQNKNLCNALEKSFQFFSKDLGISRKEFDKRMKKLSKGDVKVKLMECDEFVKIFNYFYKK